MHMFVLHLFLSLSVSPYFHRLVYNLGIASMQHNVSKIDLVKLKFQAYVRFSCFVLLYIQHISQLIYSFKTWRQVTTKASKEILCHDEEI